MSCMHLPANHIAAMMGSVQAHTPYETLTTSSLATLTESAKELAEANANAFNDRYHHRIAEGGIDEAKPGLVTADMIEKWALNPLSIADTNRAIQCYQYQCSDWRDWVSSKQERLTLYMQRILLDASAGESDVWVVSDEPKGQVVNILSL